MAPALAEMGVVAVLRSTLVDTFVRPGEIPTTPSVAVHVPAEAYFISTLPSAKNDSCIVARRVESNTGTLHHVAVNASEAERTNTLPPADGSRSAKKGASRGAPERSLPISRALL